MTFELIDSQNAVFRVLGALECQLTGNFLWVSEEIDEDGASGVVFRAYDEVEDADPEYVGYVLFADVTGDPDEPDTTCLSADNLAEVDELMSQEIAKQFNVLEWTDPQLNIGAQGTKMLMNAYKVLDEDVVYQKVSHRITLSARKWVMIICFVPSRFLDFGRCTWSILDNVRFI